MATEIRIRWDRILAIISILSLPFIIHWIKNSIHIRPFRDIPILGSIANMPEVKALFLLALLLIAGVMILGIMRKHE